MGLVRAAPRRDDQGGADPCRRGMPPGRSWPSTSRLPGCSSAGRLRCSSVPRSSGSPMETNRGHLGRDPALTTMLSTRPPPSLQLGSRSPRFQRPSRRRRLPNLPSRVSATNLAERGCGVDRQTCSGDATAMRVPCVLSLYSGPRLWIWFSGSEQHGGAGLTCRAMTRSGLPRGRFVPHPTFRGLLDDRFNPQEDRR